MSFKKHRAPIEPNISISQYRKRSSVPMSIINYKNATLLRRYINRTRKIIPRRANGISPKDHRAIAKAIRQARGIRIIPFVRLTLLG